MFSAFRIPVQNYLNQLGEHYGGKIKCETMVLHVKPCLRDLIIYSTELFIFSEDE